MSFSSLCSVHHLCSRTFWAEVREEYFSSGVNRQSMEIIEKAALVMVLDEEEYRMVSEGEARCEHGCRC